MRMRKDHRTSLSFSFIAPVSEDLFEKTITAVLASVLPSFGHCLSLHSDVHGYPTHTESNDCGLHLSVGPEFEGAPTWCQQDRRR